MINYILIGVSCVILFLSIISVLTEGINKNTPTGRFFRRIRITLRELNITHLITVAVILFIIGLLVKDKNFYGIILDIGILCLSYLILDCSWLFSKKRMKKPAKLKEPLPERKLSVYQTNFAGRTKTAEFTVVVKRLPELEPVIIDVPVD